MEKENEKHSIRRCADLGRMSVARCRTKLGDHHSECGNAGEAQGDDREEGAG